MIKVKQTSHRGPKNRHLPEIVREVTNSLSNAIRQQYDNSLKASGYPCLIYNKLDDGIPCSCVSLTSPILDSEGNLSASQMSGILSSVAILKPGSRADERTDISQKPVYKPEANLTGSESSVVNDDHNFIITEDTKEDEADYDPEEILENFLDDSYLGSGSTKCRSCYGTGIVGGFSVYKGFRKVLTVESLSASHNAHVDGSKTPNGVVFDETDGWAEFLTVVPRKCIAVTEMRLWDSDFVHSLKSYTLEAYLDSAWVVLNRGNLLSIALGKEVRLRVKPTANGLERFTHIELQFGCSSESVYCDIPKIEQLIENGSIYAGQSPINIVLPTTVHKINRLSVIYEATHGSFWKVINVSDWVNSSNQVQGWEAECVRVQNFESLNDLPRLNNTTRSSKPTNRTKSKQSSVQI